MTAVAVATPIRLPRVRGKRRLRRTEVQNLLCCPMWKTSNSEEAARGSVLHDAIARYLHACLASGEESRLADVETIAREAFYASPRGLDPGWYPEYLSIFDAWAHARPADPETIYRDPVTGVVGIEMEFETEVDCAILWTTLDLVRRLDDGDDSEPPTRVLFLDHKSQQGIARHEFQMGFAAWIMCRSWPTVEEVVTVADHFRRRSGMVETTWTRDQALAWGEDMLYGLRRYFAGPKRTAVGGPACRYCARRRACPKAVEPWRSMPENDEEAIAAYRERARLREVAEVIWKGLKAYTEPRQPLVIDGQRVGWQLPQSGKYVVPDPGSVRDHLNTEHSRRGDDVTGLVVFTDKLTQDELDELQLAGLVHLDRGKLQFKERAADPVDDRVPEPGVPEEDGE
jgi:PD-(D/E)XK nuclease superfamily